MATVEAVQTRALRRLGVLARGQTARSEDMAEMAAAYAEVYAVLDSKNLAVWGDVDDDVPNEYSRYIAAMVAWARVDEFSVPTERYQRLQIANAAALPALRDLIRPLIEQPPAEYF